MNEFTFLANAWRNPRSTREDLDELSMRLAQTPCGPLYKSYVSPDRELAALLGDAPGLPGTQRRRQRPHPTPAVAV